MGAGSGWAEILNQTHFHPWQSSNGHKRGRSARLGAFRGLQPAPGTAAALADPQRAPQRITALPSFFPIPNMPEPRGPRRLLLSARLITPNSPSRYCVQAELPPLIAVIFSSACAGGRGDVPRILILHSRLTPAARMRPLHRWLLLGDGGAGGSNSGARGQQEAEPRPGPSLGTGACPVGSNGPKSRADVLT